MNDETKKQIALYRYKLIAPVIAEPMRSQNAYFREVEKIEHPFPHYGMRRVAVSTLKNWLKVYNRRGFDALIPKKRLDAGRPRRLGEIEKAAIVGKCRSFPDWTVQMLYEDLKKNHQLGHPPACYNTLLRFVTHENLLPTLGRTDGRKRFEMDAVLDMWVCDFMHGPKVEYKSRKTKAILCAVIDDHSRVIVGQTFSVNEDVTTLTNVLKEAIETHGLPKRLYVDNGAAFSSEHLNLACARAKISLSHSKPYDSPSRGKIERFFRTVRDRFLPNLGKNITLDELNMTFSLWLKEDYHHKVHTGIDGTPMDRYRASISKTEIRRLSHAELDDLFLVQHTRKVNNDATISFKGKIYEVPTAYIRQTIDIRHPSDDTEKLYLYENGARITTIKPVDIHENAKVFRPDAAKSPVKFAKNKDQA